MKQAAIKGPAQRLSIDEWAFARAWAQGLPLDQAARRYLRPVEALSTRQAKALLQPLLVRLRALARAQGRPDLAGLLARDPDAMVELHGERPTLESFREQFPDDFYSEAELVALYEEAHGSNDARSTARRRERLRTRQLAALQWLETQAAPRQPRPEEALSAWLDAPLARRLAAGGLVRVGELVQAMQLEARWYTRIPRLGPVGARRLEDWLRSEAPDLLPPQTPQLVAAAQQADLPAPGVGIVPIERWSPPPALDGQAGRRRAPAAQCRSAARSDLEAVQVWLAKHPAGSHTWRAYRREAERLLLWVVLERGKPLSSMDADDCRAYLDFLARPAPGWTAGRHTRRDSPDWRPFEGPLSAGSVATAQRILQQLFRALVRARYLDSDPWEELQPAPPEAAADGGAPPRPAERSMLPPQAWARLSAWLKRRADSPAGRRLRLVLVLVHATGLRPSELSLARVADLLPVEPSDDVEDAAQATRRWQLQVGDAKGHARRLWLPRLVQQALAAHLADRGHGQRVEAWSADLPLVARLRNDGPLSAMRLYELVRSAGEACARDAQDGAPEAAEALRRLSARWLRGGHARTLVDSGLPLAAVQAVLGHRSLASTAAYARSAPGLSGSTGAALVERLFPA